MEFPMRLNKFLAHQGYATRRSADTLIEKRRVFVNGKPATLGQKVEKTDLIEIKDFGAIIELLRNKEGLLHVSELSTDDREARQHPDGNVGFVRQHLQIGQTIEVLCIGVDPVQGTVKLSRKALVERKRRIYSGGDASTSAERL